MKRASLVAMVIILGLVLVRVGMAAPQSQVPELGDVRYSVLDATHFRAVNGSGWILMDGRSINETALCTGQGFCQLPDARGVFIRGMNSGRDPTSGDTAGDRNLGSSQSDDLREHDHDESTEIIGNCRGGFGTGGGNGGCRIQDIGIRTTGSRGGKETRPRNIALYTYIKVDK
jgi:hypothetical protein